MNILRGQFLLCIVLHGKRQRGLRRSDEACPLGPTSKAAIDVCAFLPCGSFVWGCAKSVKQGLSPVRMRTYHMRLPDNAAKALSEAAGFEAAKRGSALEAAFSSLHADRLICLKGALGAFPFCTCSAQGRRKRRSRPCGVGETCFRGSRRVQRFTIDARRKATILRRTAGRVHALPPAVILPILPQVAAITPELPAARPLCAVPGRARTAAHPIRSAF